MTPTATSPPLRRVLQTDFTAEKGNALQACFASLYGLDLDDVPNFIADPRGYLDAINSWLASRDYLSMKQLSILALSFSCDAALLEEVMRTSS
ncbi:hypothetical protein AaE_004600 [Aphanomyces astaci]|uniref:Uncharacterized protein n=1 Tax=Aphanomyces astaci TaxID=112090 RepID=A0A6A5APJ5_APHAT|nr:hypothetical protein AaE_004600 [Aphanomyces astaci]